MAFDPRVEGKVIDLQLRDRSGNEVLLEEAGSHAKWSGLAGLCLDGPGMGRRLRPLLTTQFVVENWKLHYPHGAVYHGHGDDGPRWPHGRLPGGGSAATAHSLARIPT